MNRTESYWAWPGTTRWGGLARVILSFISVWTHPSLPNYACLLKRMTKFINRPATIVFVCAMACSSGVWAQAWTLAPISTSPSLYASTSRSTSGQIDYSIPSSTSKITRAKLLYSLFRLLCHFAFNCLDFNILSKCKSSAKTTNTIIHYVLTDYTLSCSVPSLSWTWLLSG